MDRTRVGRAKHAHFSTEQDYSSYQNTNYFREPPSRLGAYSALISPEHRHEPSKKRSLSNPKGKISPVPPALPAPVVAKKYRAKSSLRPAKASPYCRAPYDPQTFNAYGMQEGNGKPKRWSDVGVREQRKRSLQYVDNTVQRQTSVRNRSMFDTREQIGISKRHVEPLLEIYLKATPHSGRSGRASSRIKTVTRTTRHTVFSPARFIIPTGRMSRRSNRGTTFLASLCPRTVSGG